MHDLFPACNCLTRPEGLNLIIQYFNLIADVTNHPENTEFALVEMTEFILGPQVTATTCNATPTARLPGDSSRWRGLANDDLGAVENPRRRLNEREYSTRQHKQNLREQNGTGQHKFDN